MENLPSDNIEIGVELHNAVGWQDAQDPLSFNKLKEISSYFENRPGGAWEIKSIVGKKVNPEIKNIDHLLNYVSLNKRKESLAKELETLSGELKYYV